MRVLIVGGTGFIGQHIAHRLLERGYDVAVMHRGNTEADLPASVQHIHKDLKELREEDAIEVDAVIHTCALSQEDAQAVVRVFRGRTGKLVVLSSGDVYRAYGVLCGTEPGAPEPVPITENSRLRTSLYPYGDSMPDYEKILVERAVMGVAGLPACVLRLPCVYGPGDRNHRFLGWVKRMDDRRPAILLGRALADWRWTHGYVENVADAIAAAAVDSRTAGATYNIGESEALPTRERIARIAAAAGWSGSIAAIEESLLPSSLRLPFNFRQDMAVSTARFRGEVGNCDPVSDDEALARTVAWERSAPPESIDPRLFDYAAEDAVLARF